MSTPGLNTALDETLDLAVKLHRECVENAFGAIDTASNEVMADLNDITHLADDLASRISNLANQLRTT
jgi:hypothetical protein